MSITLKRPMFRRGGPASYGVGITSGLERKKYEKGTNPFEETSLDIDLKNYPYDTGMEEGEDLTMNLSATTNANVVNPNMDMTREIYAREFGKNLEKQLTPTYRDQVLDFLTAFGASAAPAGQFQTISDALGKTGKNFQTIFDPKIQRAKQAGVQGYLAGLKGADKEKLLKYQQQARDLFNADQKQTNPKFKTLDDALAFVVTQEIYGKDRSQERLEKDADTKILKFNLTKGAALAEATIERRLEQDLEFQKKYAIRYKGSINESLFQKDTTTGNYILKNLQSKPNIRVNDVFVEPYTKKLYYFDGKKLVPEIN